MKVRKETDIKARPKWK